MPPVVRSRSERGSLLILGLLVSAAVMLVGFGIASLQMARKSAGEAAVLRAQAQACALSAFEDARLKLEMDPKFPPGNEHFNHDFSYGEEWENGAYFVKVSREFSSPPYQVLRVWATGIVGSSADPLAEVTYYGEIDICPQDRFGSQGTNPSYYQPIALSEVTQ